MDRSTQPKDVFRICPRCGSKNFDFDGHRAFLCRECRFHFFINSSAAVAAVIVDDEGRILFTVRAHEPKKGFFDLPGGFVDPLESAEVALVREIKEELGLDVVRWRYLCSFPNEYVFAGLSVFTTDLGFVVETNGFANIKADDDIVGFEFVHPHEVDFSKIGAESIANIVRNYIAGNTQM